VTVCKEANDDKKSAEDKVIQTDCTSFLVLGELIAWRSWKGSLRALSAPERGLGAKLMHFYNFSS
jgi:hypothetical protein